MSSGDERPSISDSGLDSSVVDLNFQDTVRNHIPLSCARTYPRWLAVQTVVQYEIQIGFFITWVL